MFIERDWESDYAQSLASQWAPNIFRREWNSLGAEFPTCNPQPRATRQSTKTIIQGDVAIFSYVVKHF